MSHLRALDKQTPGLHLVGLRKRRLFGCHRIAKTGSFDRFLPFLHHLVCRLLEVSQRAHHLLQTAGDLGRGHIHLAFLLVGDLDSRSTLDAHLVVGLGMLLLDGHQGFFGSLDLAREDLVVFFEVFGGLCPALHGLGDKVPPFAVGLQRAALSFWAFSNFVTALWRDLAVVCVA